MHQIHRAPSEGFSATVTWLADLFCVDRRIATLLTWEVAFKIGTDRHYWIDEFHARRFIDNNCERPLASTQA